MSQLPTGAAEMSSKYGAIRSKSDGIIEHTRTSPDESPISDLSLNTHSPPKMMHVQNMSKIDRTSQAGNHIMHGTEDEMSTSLPLPRSQTLPQLSDKSTNILSRRGFDFNLSSRFRELTRSYPRVERETGDAVFHRNHTEVYAKGATRHHIIRSSSLGPLTPPHEVESISWLPFTSSTGQIRHSTDETTGGSTSTMASTVSNSGVSFTAGGGGVLPAADPFASQSASDEPWLHRAFRVASKQCRFLCHPSTDEIISSSYSFPHADSIYQSHLTSSSCESRGSEAHQNL